MDVGLRRPTLDDVFLALTGHAAEAGAPALVVGRRPGQTVPLQIAGTTRRIVTVTLGARWTPPA